MLTIFPKTESLSVPVKNRQALVLLRQFTLEELYKAWGQKARKKVEEILTYCKVFRRRILLLKQNRKFKS